MNSGDTIVAISSAVGQAARMIVRISGPESIQIARNLGVGADQCGGSASRCVLTFADLRVPAWVYLFRAPRSYSGEDLVEFHLPGSPVLVKILMDELLRQGARPAEPGEFTARAYFNGRIDLSAAEAVAATIAARNEQELSASRQLMAGELARRLAPAMDLLAETLALVEVGIDFSEEDVSFLSAAQLRERIDRVNELLDQLQADSSRFEALAHEPRVVLVGRPNAGKSTLLNALAGRDRAVISPVAGTTRDVLWADVALPHGIVRLIDAAGIEEADAPEGTAPSHIDRQMRQQALRAVEEADVVVLVHECTDARPRLELPRDPALIVRSKLDLIGAGGHFRDEDPLQIAVSALTGERMQDLRVRLDSLCFTHYPGGQSLALNVRHLRLVSDASAAMARALDRLDAERPELLALELREAADSLGEILGRLSPDDLLARIFSGFCIGK